MEFICINVYAPQRSSDKRRLWEELTSIIRETNTILILLIWDFNSVLSHLEKENCSYSSLDTNLFAGFMELNSLVTAPLFNTMFTWYGPLNKKSKLDRAILNEPWSDMGNWFSQAYHRRNSDHKPPCLRFSRLEGGPKPFKFSNVWLEDKCFVQQVGQVWNNSRSSNIQIKFKRLKEYAKQWNESGFGNINLNITKAKHQKELADLNNAHALVKKKIKHELNDLYIKKISMLNQTARSNWQLLGEKNTKFFHRAIMKRRKRNTLLRLQVGNVWKSDQNNIKDAFYSHYRSFLGKRSTPKIFLLNSGLLTALEEEDKKAMVQAFNMSEI